MAEKRKKVVLSIQDKLVLIEKFERGSTAVDLAKKYLISPQTVRDISKNKEKLLDFARSYGSIPCKRKSMKKSPYEQLEFALLDWLNQERSNGISVTGPMCLRQAKLIYEALGLPGAFGASNGWLNRFQKRHGIRAGDFNLHAATLNQDCSNLVQEMGENGAFLLQNPQDMLHMSLSQNAHCQNENEDYVDGSLYSEEMNKAYKTSPLKRRQSIKKSDPLLSDDDQDDNAPLRKYRLLNIEIETKELVRKKAKVECQLAEMRLESEMEVKEYVKRKAKAECELAEMLLEEHRNKFRGSCTMPG